MTLINKFKYRFWHNYRTQILHKNGTVSSHKFTKKELDDLVLSGKLKMVTNDYGYLKEATTK